METLRICNRSVILRKFGSTCSKTLNPNSAWRRHCLQTPSTSTISFVFRCFPLFVGFDVDPSLGFAKSLHVLITMWILRRDHRVAFGRSGLFGTLKVDANCGQSFVRSEVGLEH